jgi:CRP-like cAMP-binding protein
VPAVDQLRIANRLLLALPRTTLARLRPALHVAVLPRGQPMDRANGPIEHLYFVNRGFVSVIKTMRDGRSVEVGGVGIEGMTDPNSLFGINSAVLDTIVQIPGNAFRIQRELLKREMEADPALRQVIQNYASFAFGQLAQSAACNRLHSLEERCCRWLLIGHDSALSESFPLTHEFLAMMLGVQRAGVSIAARSLKQAGLIGYRRGQVTILDRSGLEDAACECYGSLRIMLEQLLPLQRAQPSEAPSRPRSFADRR